MNASQMTVSVTTQVPSSSHLYHNRNRVGHPCIPLQYTRCLHRIQYRCHATEDREQPERVHVTHLDLVPGTGYAQKCLGASLALFLGGLCITSNAVAGIDTTTTAAAAAAATFENTCAGCHAGGGNIVKRDATLSLSDLQKYGLDGPDALYSIIYNGNGSMPGYGTDCAPKGKCTFGKRLSDSEISDVATYILNKAKSGW